MKSTKETDKLANSSTAQTLEELINDLVKQKQLTEDEKDIISGNEEKGIEAEYEITIGNRTIEVGLVHFSVGSFDFVALPRESWWDWLQRNSDSEVIRDESENWTSQLKVLGSAIENYVDKSIAPNLNWYIDQGDMYTSTLTKSDGLNILWGMKL